MSKGREIQCYDYVNHPYEQVCGVLGKDAPAVFQSATKAAASRAQSIASELRNRFRRDPDRSRYSGFGQEHRSKGPRSHLEAGHSVAARMGGREDATPFSAHEGGPFHLSINSD
jgi:hypothetical protein